MPTISKSDIYNFPWLYVFIKKQFLMSIEARTYQIE